MLLHHTQNWFLPCIWLLVWLGLVCRRLPELKVPNLNFSLICSISFSEVPTPFERGARATELEISGALVERPLEWVLPLPGPGIMGEANWDVTCPF